MGVDQMEPPCFNVEKLFVAFVWAEITFVGSLALISLNEKQGVMKLVLMLCELKKEHRSCQGQNVQEPSMTQKNKLVQAAFALETHTHTADPSVLLFPSQPCRRARGFLKNGFPSR